MYIFQVKHFKYCYLSIQSTKYIILSVVVAKQTHNRFDTCLMKQMLHFIVVCGYNRILGVHILNKNTIKWFILVYHAIIQIKNFFTIMMQHLYALVGCFTWFTYWKRYETKFLVFKNTNYSILWVCGCETYVTKTS